MNKCFSYRLYRGSCVQRGPYYIKDLRILNRAIEHSILIDNSIVSFMSQLDNGIPINTFVGDHSDTQVYKVTNILSELQNADDVRPLLREKYCLSNLLRRYQEIKNPISSIV